MEINFDKNINLFNNKTKIEIIKLLPKYRNIYKPIFNRLINEIEFDKQFIENIHIIHNKQEYGTVINLIRKDKITFIIELSDEIIPFFITNSDTTEFYKSKTVFQHEILHCKEAKYLFDNKILTSNNPLENNFTINTTYNFIYKQAVLIWSEFYLFTTTIK